MSTTYATQYEGNFLEAADLLGREVEVEIREVVPANTVRAEDGQIIPKPILYFAGAKKGLILNKTNARRIILCYAPDRPSMDEWVGLKITLLNEDDRRPDMNGRKGPCVRVKIK